MPIEYDIIIPHCNVEGSDILAAACLRTIREYSKDYRIIWIQNGGSIPDRVSTQLSLCKAPLYVQQNGDNEGFVRAVNDGLRYSSAPYIVIMNNDTEAVSEWLTKLRAPLDGRVMLSGPRTTTPESWQGKIEPGVGVRILPRNYMLAFFCVMMDRRLLTSVGYLDEEFGVGFGDDDNYCARVHLAGYRIALVQDLVIPHKHRHTFRQIYTDEQIRSMQREALNLHFEKLNKKGI